jgi:hypothetical protein
MSTVSQAFAARVPAKPLSKTATVLDLWAHIEPRFGGVGPAASSLADAVEGGSRWQSELLAVCRSD